MTTATRKQDQDAVSLQAETEESQRIARLRKRAARESRKNGVGKKRHPRKQKAKSEISGYRMKPTCLFVERELPAIEREAMRRNLEVRVTYPNLEVRVTYPTFHSCATMHVMFDMDGRRVLNWWPAKGTTLTANGVRGFANDSDEAIMQAVHAANEMEDSKQYACNL